MSNRKELIQIWFQRVWNENDDSAIKEMFAGGIVRGLGAQTKFDPDSFRSFKTALCEQITNINISIDKCVEDDVWVCALCTLRAKSSVSGTDVMITGNVWARIEDGKIQEAYNHFDFLGLWSQLGLLPADSFEQGLLGQKIV